MIKKIFSVLKYYLLVFILSILFLWVIKRYFPDLERFILISWLTMMTIGFATWFRFLMFLPITSKRIFIISSWYPVFWTIAILIYTLSKNYFPYTIVPVMMSWVLMIYVGSLTWLGLLIYLPIKKILTIKQTIAYILLVFIGIYIAILITEYDVFSSGVKYID